MSDLEILDRAFDSLARDLAHSPGPGAAAAMATARTRRRTRVGAVALAALVVVGGGLTVPRLLFPEDGVAAGGGSARFDVAALTAATEGWIGDWEDWERYSPYGGGGFGAESCAQGPDGSPAPEPAADGVSRFVSHSGSSAVLLVQHFADTGSAASAQALSQAAPDTCGTTTTYDVDGARVRHDSMPQEGGTPTMWLGDVWTVRIGTDRAYLEVTNDTGVADDATAEEVAEALVAGLRDGWTQSGMSDAVPPPETKGQLPEWSDVDLEGALAGWRAASQAAASAFPQTPCLGEMLEAGGVTTSGGGTRWGVTHRIVGFDDDTSGPARVQTMLTELRGCTDAGMEVETLPSGVHVATYDTGGPAGRGALWFAAEGDRAGLIGVDGADRPMPMGAREDVADALRTILLLPWD